MGCIVNRLRRKLCCALTASILLPITNVKSKEGKLAEPYYDPALLEKWMHGWMSITKAVSGALHMGRFADRMYYLTKTISWKPGKQKNLPAVTVPTGFVTDLASVPRIFWTIFPPDGQYTYPAILHDYLYWSQHTSREEADLILMEAMKEFDVGSVSSEVIYAAVRVGGGRGWDSNNKLKSQGEKRILKRFPKDPKIKWKDWKIRPEVY